MTSAQPDITALLGSRICHDLISPLGAISNGVELLAMTGAAKGPELELISESVENANARIRYFRVAYGATSTDQAMASGELRSILDDMTRGTRLRITWNPDGDVPREQAKLVFLMLQCLETALPWGGQVEVSQQNGRWSLQGTSERMKVSPQLWHILSSDDALPEINPSEVQFLLFAALMRQCGRTLALDLGADRIIAAF